MQTLSTTSSTIFNPGKMSSLSLWLDAADKSTITHTSNAVSQWNDKSLNAWHVTQATSASRPITNTITKNGLNVLSFDGVDDHLLNSSNSLFKNINGFAWFVVFQNLNANSSRIVHKQVPSSVNNRAGFTSNRTAGKYEALARRLETDAAAIATSSGGTNTNWNLLTQTVNFSTGVNNLRINKVQSGTATTTIGTSENLNGGSIAICSQGVTQFMQGYIAETIAYSKILTTEEINLVEGYLSSKWAI